MKTQINELKEKLQEFNGSDVIFRIPLIQTRFTSGIKYFAKAAECYWLITDTSVIAKSLINRSYFICIDFRRLPEIEQKRQGYDMRLLSLMVMEMETFWISTGIL